ncbi:retrovirus-related pol polyprotein from transposon TNT 1-94 [Tanacetum coccineum]
MYTASLKRSENYKAQPYQYASPSKQILKAKAKPFPSCKHCGINDHKTDDCRNYHECEILLEAMITLPHDAIVLFRLEEEDILGGHLVRTKWVAKGSMTGVKSYLHKYVEQPGPKGSTIELHSKLNKTSPSRSVCIFFIWTYLDQISQNLSSPYTPEQNGVAERRNITLIEAARTMLNGSVLSKHFWTDAVRIACYTQNRSIIFKRHDRTSYEIFRERILDISYFHVFRCLVFIHNHKDHLGKFDAKADDGYFLGYSSVSKDFRVYNIRRQQIEETYHVTFDESMEAIRFTNTSIDEIGIDDSSRYPPDEFQEDDPSRKYQVDSNVSYYIIPHGRSLTKITQENHVPEVIAPNEPEIPHTKDDEGPPDLINTKGTHEQYVQNDQMITQPTDVPSGNNTKVLGSIIEPLVLDVTQSHITNQASTSILTRSMATKLTASLASECLFVDFLSEIEPKKVYEALKHPGWIDAMQEELN